MKGGVYLASLFHFVLYYLHMTRTTKTIELPISKVNVVLKNWLTGGEKRRIGTEDDKNAQLGLMIDTLIVSIDGKSTDLIKTVDDLHGKDFDFIFKEITEIIEESSLSVEKKS